MECYRLSFTAPFHVDSRGNNFYEQSNSFIHSDTLSAAITAIWSLIEPEQAAQNAQQPGFKLSSAFPFYGDCYFLPRALPSQAIKLADDCLQEAKKLKKIQWLETSLWKRSFKNADWMQQIRICQSVLAAGHDRSLPEFLWREEERPRLAMDRASGQSLESQLFNFGRIWFHQDGGLYFLAVFDNDACRQRFETLLTFLGDSGIGADRSNGNGFFKWKKGQNPGLSLAQDERTVALSLVNPDPVDCQNGWLDGSAYKLVSRGGWIGNTGRRKQRLRMFAEGSVFARPLQGRIVEVSGEDSPHSVYRDGRGFFIKAGES